MVFLLCATRSKSEKLKKQSDVLTIPEKAPKSNPTGTTIYKPTFVPINGLNLAVQIITK